MSPSYDEVVNGQDRFIKVMKVSRSDKVGVPHPEWFGLTVPKDVSDDDDIFIRFHRNLKMINK